LTASGAVVDGGDGAHLAGVGALLRIDVRNDHLARYRGRRDVHGAATDAACADDDEMVVDGNMLAGFLQRREGGDTGAGIGRGETLRDAVVRQQVAAMRHDDVRAVAASPARAESARGEAK
jgi:hypothetical protein